MARTTWSWMAGAMLGSSLIGAVPAAAQDAAAPTLTVFVVDYAAVPVDILDTAKKHATRIFRGSNVELVWLEHGDARFKDPAVLRSVITIHIMSGHMVEGAHKRTRAMGWAALRTRIAKVSYDGIADLLEGHAGGARETGSVLGHVIAHEIGHLLLGSRRHAVGGIMQARLDRRGASLGALFFLADEADVIQTKLLSR